MAPDERMTNLSLHSSKNGFRYNCLLIWHWEWQEETAVHKQTSRWVHSVILCSISWVAQSHRLCPHKFFQWFGTFEELAEYTTFCYSVGKIRRQLGSARWCDGWTEGVQVCLMWEPRSHYCEWAALHEVDTVMWYSWFYNLKKHRRCKPTSMLEISGATH